MKPDSITGKMRVNIPTAEQEAAMVPEIRFVFWPVWSVVAFVGVIYAIMGAVGFGGVVGTPAAALCGALSFGLGAAVLIYLVQLCALNLDWRYKQTRWRAKVERRSRKAARAALRSPAPLVGRNHPAQHI
jgi:hypothetical protein